jgi:hypothetical protein
MWNAADSGSTTTTSSEFHSNQDGHPPHRLLCSQAPNTVHVYHSRLIATRNITVKKNHFDWWAAMAYGILAARMEARSMV